MTEMKNECKELSDSNGSVPTDAQVLAWLEAFNTHDSKWKNDRQQFWRGANASRLAKLSALLDQDFYFDSQNVKVSPSEARTK
jgi:hypothetical protein